jgi:hypothetical protein
MASLSARPRAGYFNARGLSATRRLRRISYPCPTSFGPTGVGADGIAAHVDPAYPLAWREGPIGQLLQDAVNDGVKIFVVVGQKRHAFNTTLDELDRLATQENRVPVRP